MEDFINCDIEFEDLKLNNLVITLNDLFKRKQEDLTKLCTCVAELYYYCKENPIKDKKCYYYNVYQLLEKFGLKKKSVERLVAIYNKFICGIDHVDSSLKSAFFRFSFSKLRELVVVPIDRLYNDIDLGVLSPGMTYKQIRDYVKSIKGKTSEDEESEEDIPFAFDPKQVYEFQYFDGLSKSQLVNIAMSYQNYIHKGKNG